jgi:uncharacterized protein YkwD
VAATQCPNTDVTPGTVPTSVLQEATLCLLNEQRAAAGEVALVAQPQLEEAAAGYSSQMVVQGFFAHVSPQGTTLESRVRATQYTVDASWTLGENIAWGSGALATPGNIMIAWMNSAEHRRNILDGEFREVGIGIVAGTPSAQPAAGATYTTDFGIRTEAGSVTGSAARSTTSANTSTTGTPSRSGKPAITKRKAHKRRAHKKHTVTKTNRGTR